MKKLLILAAIGMVSTLTSFGQGYLVFNNSAGTAIKDNFTFGYQTNSPGTVLVGFLWTGAGTNQTLSALGTSSTTSSTSPNWAWLAGAQGAGWNFGTNASSGLLLAPKTAATPTFAQGVIAGGTVGLLGTSAGEQITGYVVAWSAAYADPFSAAAAGGALGWSNPLNYTLGASSAPAVTLNADGMTSFTVNPVPEPATFALAGLGAAAMLIFRRRK